MKNLAYKDGYERYTLKIIMAGKWYKDWINPRWKGFTIRHYQRWFFIWFITPTTFPNQTGPLLFYFLAINGK